MTPYVWAWLGAFAFTQVVEVPLYRALLPCSARAAFVPTLLTHPIVWFVLFPYLQASYTTRLWLAELFAVITEALVCLVLLRRAAAEAPEQRLPNTGTLLPRALAVATCANVASLALGLTSRRLFGVP